MRIYHGLHITQNQDTQDRALARAPTPLLPLFQESAHAVPVIRHSMDVVRNAITHIKAGLTPVLTFDQPLFALAKQNQWKWPEKYRYGKEKIVVIFGGLDIKMEAIYMRQVIGDWLEVSGMKLFLV